MTKSELPFWDHIEELRKVILRCLAVVALSAFAIFVFLDPLTSLLRPSLLGDSEHVKRFYIVTERQIDQGSGLITERQVEIPQTNLFIFGPLEGFQAGMKFSLLGGALFSSPIWLYLLATFALPALRPRERRWALPLLILLILSLIAGLVVGTTFTLPALNLLLSDFNQGLGINLWSYSLYLQYALLTLLATVFFFEFIALLFFSVHFGIITPEHLSRARSWAIVLIFIISAIVTPPDILSQIAMAVPLVIFYEGAILYGKIRNYFRLAYTKSLRSFSSM